jgi:hypothetical protein
MMRKLYGLSMRGAISACPAAAPQGEFAPVAPHRRPQHTLSPLSQSYLDPI